MGEIVIPEDIAAMGQDELIAELKDLPYRSNFAAGLIEWSKTNAFTDQEIAGARRVIASARRRRELSAPIDLSPVRDMFEAARATGHKRPVYRAEGLALKRAPDGGKNPGAIYVTTDRGDVYQGKVIAQTFHPAREIDPETITALRKIAENPRQAAVEHGRRTGRCACCGRPLSDPESVELGIGPHCAKRWGLA